MSETPRIRASTISDLAALLPRLFGYTPTESFIGIELDGPQIGFRLRMDLAEMSRAGAFEVAAKYLSDKATDRIVLLAVTDDRQAAQEALTGVSEALAGRFPIVNSTWIGRSTYANSNGRGDEEPLEKSVIADHVSIDFPAAARLSREQVAETFAPTGENLAWDGDAPPTLDELRHTLTEALSHPGDLPDAHIASLATVGGRIAERDAMWTMIDLQNAAEMVRIWKQVATRAVPSPDLYFLLGFACWQAGDGAQTLMALDQSSKGAGGHAATQMLRTLLARGVSPERWLDFLD